MATKIVLDPGHNGVSDPGAVYNGRRESDDVLNLSRAVGEILARNGYDVEYTRTGNIEQSVGQKAQFANNTGADLFVSLHRNSASYPGQYNGVQTLIYDRSGFKPEMAENINRNLENVGFQNINVETRPDLAVLRRTQMPALLVEAGFIDSAKDNRIFDSRFDEIAQAIADGIMETLDGMAAAEKSADPPHMDYAALTGIQNPYQVYPDQIQNRTTRPNYYYVQVGRFSNLQDAVTMEHALKRHGYNPLIITE